jgi:hypothetical protein
LRHTSRYRPLVVGPRDVGVFDELVVSHDASAAQVIPEAMRILAMEQG